MAAIKHLPDKDVEDITRDDIRKFLIERREQVSETTVSIEFRALKVFFRWLADEEEIQVNPTNKVKAPKVINQPPPVYSDKEIVLLLSACQESRSKFVGVRDTALIMLLLDCGMRRSELINVNTNDVDLEHGVILLRVTKNRSPRIVPIGQRATLALDRYMRIRRRHPLAYLEALWLGQGGRLTDNGLYQALRQRGRAAGVTGVRPHRFRHSWAHRASLAGMQTADLMAIAGWRSVGMTLRYGASAAQERAIAAHRKFSPLDNLAR
jgi:integrase